MQKTRYEEYAKLKECAYPGPSQLGLTKRELFAAMAMQGYISTNNHDAITRCMDDDYKYPSQVIAKLGVEAADALIKELGK